MEKRKSIEEVFKQTLDTQTTKPSSKVLKQLRWKLFAADFFSYNFRKFNVIYVTLLIAGLVFSPKIISFHQEDSKVIVEKPSIEILDNELVVNNDKPSNIDEVSTQIEFNQEDEVVEVVTALYEMSSFSGCAPLQIHFKNKSSHASQYLWEFGTGEVSSKVSPEYIFDNPGVFIVTLTTLGKDGTKAVQQQKVKVYEKPRSSFEIDVTASDVNARKVLFKNSSKNAVNYKWSFGDNITSEEKSPTHIYNSYKTYNVSMIAISEHGCRDTASYFNSFVAEDYSFVFPKKFKPNISGPNNGFYERPENASFVFYPQNHGAIKYTLSVKTPAGVEIFKTTDVKKGWNGYINGRIASAGKYSYTASGTYPNGKEFKYNGTFSLVVDKSFQDYYNN